MIYIDGESGSISAVEVGDGARYWKKIDGLMSVTEGEKPLQ